MNRTDLRTDAAGRLLVSRRALLTNRIYTDQSYRTTKCVKRFEEIAVEGGRYVLFESLPESTRRAVVSKLTRLSAEYTQLLLAVQAADVDCLPAAIAFTAETLDINEPFIRSAIEQYIRANYTNHTAAYMDAGLSVKSLKGYAKQCALLEWIHDFAHKITASEPSAKRAALLMRAFRVNLLTALSGIELEIKIPLSETRFSRWLDDVLARMDKGEKPDTIVQIKRLKNDNSMKVTQEQFNIAYGFYIKGSNMSVAAVYRKWLEYGLQHGWWANAQTGAFEPPTEARLYQLLKPVKNAAMLEKTDAITYQLKMTPSVSRLLPAKRNHVWVIDGTAHNENVENKGAVRQHVYVIKVADVATMRLLGAAPLIGVREPFTAVRDAILTGIRTTGCKPAIIQCDRGPAWKELEAWCNENDIKLYPSMTGNARAKTIESLFNMFDNDITRFLSGYSGQNRTATAVRSRSSEKRENAGKRNARSASIAMTWVQTEGIRLWNERIIKTLEGAPCGKTPFELWDEKESMTPQLSYVQLCRLCGVRHDRKLTINGLDISHNAVDCTYFPPIETPEQRAAAAAVFNAIPLDAQTSNVLSVYILEPGEPAPVFDREGRFLGVWTRKQKVDYIDENGDLGKFLALAYRVREQAKTFNQSVKDDIARRPDADRIEALGNESLTGKHRKYEGFADAAKRWCGRYDKTALLEEEAAAKAGENAILLEATSAYKDLVDPDTGEIHRVLINNN
jgi:hypothetical protein